MFFKKKSKPPDNASINQELDYWEIPEQYREYWRTKILLGILKTRL